jgi:cytochrome c1
MNALGICAVAGVVLLADVIPTIDCDRHATSQGVLLIDGELTRGKQLMTDYGCVSCHTVPGIRGADANVGPPLTKFGRRTYIGGVLENTPANLVRWIENPPGVDPMTAMPNLRVDDRDAHDIAAYLYTLR